MSITPGQNANASDFIDSTENTGTSGDNGKVPKLEQVDGVEGRLAKEFLPSDTLYKATKKIEVDATEITVGNTTTETTLFDVSIPANRLGTNNAVRFKIFLSNYSQPGTGDKPVFRLKFGSTTVATLDISEDNNNTITGLQGWLEGFIVADGSASAQKGAISLFVSVAGYEGTDDATVGYAKASGAAGGSAAENTTSAKTLSVTVQWSGAAVGATLTAEFWIVEEIAS